ncbi:hypothetical protein AAHC03_013325 [Spirometra sp. Aus1]
MQKREKSKVVPAILSADILVCAGVFVVIFTWLICLLAFKDVGDYGGFNSAEQAVLFGFSHTVISDYPELEIFIQSWQYACALLVFCLLANMFNLPKKMLLLDILSAILVWCIHGWEFTLTIIIISTVFSVIGAYAGRSPLIMLFVGIVVLAYIREILRVCLPEAFVFRIFAVRVAYPGFYASVVRSIILGMEHARMPSVSLKDLFRNSFAYTIMSPVCMAASFVHFQDWMNWREGVTKFTVKKPYQLEEERHPSDTGETVKRTISFRRLLITFLRLGFWTLVLKYGFGSINLIGQLFGPVRRITRGLNAGLLDYFIVYFIAYLNVAKFHVYYVVFYGYCRTIGDLQQFMMSPLFGRDTSRLIVEQQDTQSGLLLKSPQSYNLGEKLIFTEMTMNCFMPDGPKCLLGTLTTAEVWRSFDRGLYTIMRHYIYFPWRKFVISITPTNSVALKDLGALSGAVLTFFFVLTFHSWTEGNCIWVCTSFVLWSIERFGGRYYNSMKAEEKLASLLSVEWERRIRCVGYATLQTLNILSFMFFLANYDTGFWLAKAVLTNWLVLLECWAFIYITLRLSLEVRTLFSQEQTKVAEGKKDK